VFVESILVSPMDYFYLGAFIATPFETLP
jgi:hypothetical protein